LAFPYPNSNSKQLVEICNIAKNVSVSSLNLDQITILMHFAVNPRTSAYEFAEPAVVRSGIFSSNPEATWFPKYTAKVYRNTKNQTKRLNGLKLIEEVQDQPSVRNAKYYKLTVYGVYYMIADFKGLMTSVIFKALLRNYGDHPLFQYFVYPWIKQDTLLNIPDSSIFSHLSSYLRACCGEVKDTIHYSDELEYLFTWQDIRTGTDNAKALSDFLTQKFGWSWLRNADILKRNSKVIEVRDDTHSVLINLSDDRKKATVTHKRRKEFELPVSELFNELMVQKPRRQLDETYLENFAVSHRERVQQLIFSTISDHSVELDTIRMLAQDEILWGIIKDTRNKFEQRFKLLEEGKR
jgi:hypothetical protein